MFHFPNPILCPKLQGMSNNAIIEQLSSIDKLPIIKIIHIMELMHWQYACPQNIPLVQTNKILNLKNSVECSSTKPSKNTPAFFPLVFINF